jgi:hypothetical protein
MNSLFPRNINGKGRIIRALGALALMTGAIIACRYSAWLSAILGLSGTFVAFEAARGWCALRACGIKTKV